MRIAAAVAVLAIASTVPHAVAAEVSRGDAVKHYRAGRLTGGSVNARDVGSVRCRLGGCRIEPIDRWHESLCDRRRASPAEVAALRVDFEDWYRTLSSRNQRVVKALAQGERGTGNIGTRASEARHEALTGGIRYAEEHDRDGGRRLLGSERGGDPADHENVHL